MVVTTVSGPLQFDCTKLVSTWLTYTALNFYGQPSWLDIMLNVEVFQNLCLLCCN